MELATARPGVLTTYEDPATNTSVCPYTYNYIYLYMVIINVYFSRYGIYYRNIIKTQCSLYYKSLAQFTKVVSSQMIYIIRMSPSPRSLHPAPSNLTLSMYTQLTLKPVGPICAYK